MIKPVTTVLLSLGCLAMMGQANFEKLTASKEKKEFSLASLYTAEQLTQLQIKAPEKYALATAFFTEFEGLEADVQSALNKRIMYRYFIHDKDKYNALIEEATNQTSEQ